MVPISCWTTSCNEMHISHSIGFLTQLGEIISESKWQPDRVQIRQVMTSSWHVAIYQRNQSAICCSQSAVCAPLKPSRKWCFVILLWASLMHYAKEIIRLQWISFVVLDLWICILSWGANIDGRVFNVCIITHLREKGNWIHLFRKTRIQRPTGNFLSFYCWTR